MSKKGVISVNRFDSNKKLARFFFLLFWPNKDKKGKMSQLRCYEEADCDKLSSVFHFLKAKARKRLPSHLFWREVSSLALVERT